MRLSVNFLYTWSPSAGQLGKSCLVAWASRAPRATARGIRAPPSTSFATRKCLSQCGFTSRSAVNTVSRGVIANTLVSSTLRTTGTLPKGTGRLIYHETARKEAEKGCRRLALCGARWRGRGGVEEGIAGGRETAEGLRPTVCVFILPRFEASIKSLAAGSQPSAALFSLDLRPV